MENPWKGEVCVVTHEDGTKESYDTDVFEFSTQTGEIIELTAVLLQSDTGKRMAL